MARTQSHTTEHQGCKGSASQNRASTPASQHDPSAHQHRKVSLASAIGYGFGDFFAGGQSALMATYLLLFWNRFCGLSIGAGQSIFALAAVVSAFISLCFGVFDDNLYRYRFGRRYGRRRLILFLAVPAILVGSLLWIPGLSVAIYALVYVFWICVVQTFATAYGALPGEMTPDFDQRTKLSTARLFIATATTTGIPLVGGFVLSHTGENRPEGYSGFGLAMTCAFALAVFVCWKSTWEMTPEQAGFHGKVIKVPLRARLRRIGREYASTLRVAEFRRHLVIYVLNMVSIDIFGQLFVFFVLYDLQKTTVFASMLLVCAAISLPLMPVFGRAIIAIGPRKLYAIACSGSLIGPALFGISWFLTGRIDPTAWTVLTVAVALFFFAFKSLDNYMP